MQNQVYVNRANPKKNKIKQNQFQIFLLTIYQKNKAEQVFSNNIFQEFKIINHVNTVSNIRSSDTLCLSHVRCALV